MRLFDIINEEQIDEVSMSPGALADFAKTPFAQAMTAGFEAELVIPDAQSDDEGEMEPDYDEDRRCRSTQDIRDFFEGDYNSSRQLDRAIEQIDEEFFEYADEQIRNDFEEDERDDMIRQILKDMDKTPEEIEAAARQFFRKISGFSTTSGATGEAFERAVAAITDVATELLSTLPARRQPPKTEPPLRRLAR